MRLIYSSFVYEAIGSPETKGEKEPGLMTLDEYLEYRNPDDESHPSTVYNWDLAKMNDVLSFFDSYFGQGRLSKKTTQFTAKTKNKTDFLIYEGTKLVAVLLNGVLYHNKFLHLDGLPLMYRNHIENIELDIKSDSTVKYLDEYFNKISDVKNKNISNYPKVVNRTKIGGEDFEMRVDKDGNFALLNTDGYVVGVAQDEWGATLVSVASEYRNKGIGEVLLKAWYNVHPNKKSGGYTSAGGRTDSKFWATRVREFLSNGWYSDLVKSGKLDQKRVDLIIKDLNKFGNTKSELDKLGITKEPAKKNVMVFSDGTSFIIYDVKFFEEADEKYIYGFGFLRQAEGKTFFFRLDYEKDFAKLSNSIAMQLALDNKEKIYIGKGYGDLLELNIVQDVKQEGDFAWIESPLLNLKELARIEKKFRKEIDKYDEKYYELLEKANFKWGR